MTRSRKRPGKTQRKAVRPAAAAGAGKLAAFGFTGFLVLMGAAAAIALDLPAKAMLGAAQAVGSAGFTVNGYQIAGLRSMDRKLVDAVVVDELRRAAAPTGGARPAQPLVDVSRIRDRLLRFGWVKDARVSRRLPDTLVIDVVERTPAAMWQDGQRLALIDSEGVVLDRVRIDRMPDLPLLIGPGANLQASKLDALLAQVPTLQAQLASATWVGRRRWDLAFTSGETVALPEGDRPASAALAKFAELDRSTGLLGRGLVRFDLRVPGKMIVRLPRSAGEAMAAEPAAAPPSEG